MNLRKRNIDLINCEGGILKVACINKDLLLFSMSDQWNKTVMYLDKNELIAFIDGQTSVRDSSGRIWNRLKTTASMVVDKNYIIEKLIEQNIHLF